MEKSKGEYMNWQISRWEPKLVQACCTVLQDSFAFGGHIKLLRYELGPKEEIPASCLGKESFYIALSGGIRFLGVVDHAVECEDCVYVARNSGISVLNESQEKAVILAAEIDDSVSDPQTESGLIQRNDWTIIPSVYGEGRLDYRIHSNRFLKKFGADTASGYLTAEMGYIRRGHASPAQPAPFEIVLLVLDGCVEIEIDGDTQIYRPCDSVYLMPGTRFGIRNFQSDCANILALIGDQLTPDLN